MDRKAEVSKEELEKVVGGGYRPSRVWYICNDCGARWGSNKANETRCPKCGSANIK